MAQQVNDNFEVLAAIPIDDRNKKITIAERDAIENTRRYQGLTCFVEQTDTLYILIGGIDNSNWVVLGNASSSNPVNTYLVENYPFIWQKGDGNTTDLMEVGDAILYGFCSYDDGGGAQSTLIMLALYNSGDPSLITSYTVVSYKQTEYKLNLDLRVESESEQLLLSDSITNSTVSIDVNDLATSNIVLLTPNKTTGTYTIATLSDIPATTIPNIQQVTDEGNTTTNNITILQNSTPFTITSSGGGVINLKTPALFSGTYDISLPTSVTGSQTLATLDDLPQNNAEISNDWDSIFITGNYYNSLDTATGIPFAAEEITLKHTNIDASNATQYAIRKDLRKSWIRAKNSGFWSSWVENYSNSNFLPGIDYLSPTDLKIKGGLNTSQLIGYDAGDSNPIYSYTFDRTAEVIAKGSNQSNIILTSPALDFTSKTILEVKTKWVIGTSNGSNPIYSYFASGRGSVFPTGGNVVGNWDTCTNFEITVIYKD